MKKRKFYEQNLTRPSFSKIWAGARLLARSLRLREKSAFTLIEVLIIIVIVAVVSGVAVVSALKYKASQDLRLTLNELSALIRDVQRKSVTQEDGKRWGVRFENAETGKDRMYIFKGTSFASGTITQSLILRRSAQFGEPGASSTRDIVFLPIEGSISPNKIITLNTGLRDGLFGDIIVNLLGHVTTRIDTGLVGYWHFDEGTGTSTADASGNGNTGVFGGSPTWITGTSCKEENCLNFNGGTNYISLGAVPVTYPFTIQMWIKPSAIDNDYRLMGPKDSVPGHLFWSLSLHNAAAQLTLWDGVSWKTLTGPGTFSTGNWYHIVVTVNSSLSATAYINGVGKTPVAMSPATWNISSLSIGSRYISFGNYFNGTIDEVRLYNRALSETEIANIYSDLK